MGVELALRLATSTAKLSMDYSLEDGLWIQVLAAGVSVIQSARATTKATITPAEPNTTIARSLLAHRLGRKIPQSKGVAE